MSINWRKLKVLPLGTLELYLDGTFPHEGILVQIEHPILNRDGLYMCSFCWAELNGKMYISQQITNFFHSELRRINFTPLAYAERRAILTLRGRVPELMALYLEDDEYRRVEQGRYIWR